MNKNSIIVLIEKLLGRSNRLRNEEYAFYCTFCNHHKKKLQVNLKTQKWHCWICNTGGHKIGILLRKNNSKNYTIVDIPRLLNL